MLKITSFILAAEKVGVTILLLNCHNSPCANSSPFGTCPALALGLGYKTRRQHRSAYYTIEYMHIEARAITYYNDHL